ncbi:hypothetical protein HPB50_014575 [Hyalomma asiaticum]|uniref:Uncharacterized protein n=1 Tax=Hyalomma asiaticum TaxID=266040 RepID=A0ACB7SQW7_HYAAI|nr:hypothetical protein HPB50_014575 [Hyalomma asiaticum]
MKSPKLYEHLRKESILTMPCKTTLRKYLMSCKTGYGFSTKVLDALSKKTPSMDLFQRHGGLIVDEMKLSEHLSVTAAGHIEGFVDLGPFTSDDYKHTVSDHGMVIMFVPFIGKWTQVTLQPVRTAIARDGNNVALQALHGITSSHTNPNSFEVQRVSLAFQLFSEKVTQGLRLHRATIEETCGDISATLHFFE